MYLAACFRAEAKPIFAVAVWSGPDWATDSLPSGLSQLSPHIHGGRQRRLLGPAEMGGAGQSLRPEDTTADVEDPQEGSRGRGVEVAVNSNRYKKMSSMRASTPMGPGSQDSSYCPMGDVGLDENERTEEKRRELALMSSFDNRRRTILSEKQID